MPKYTVNSTGLFASVYGQAVLAAGTTELLVLNVSASAVATGVMFDNMRISVRASLKLLQNALPFQGQTHATNGTVTVASSKIGDVPGDALEMLWKLALILIFEKEVNKVRLQEVSSHSQDTFQLTEKGISLPQIPDVQIINPSLKFGDRTITVCADIHFTIPARQKVFKRII